MEKEFANFIEIEDRIERLIDLITKLKEVNRKLIEDNEQLERKYQSVSERAPSRGKDNGNDSAALSGRIDRESKKEIRAKIENALTQLDSLKQMVSGTQA